MDDTPDREKIAPEPKAVPFILPLDPDWLDTESDNYRVAKNPESPQRED